MKFSELPKQTQDNILNTLWDKDTGDPRYSGAPVKFTIKVDQCIDKECTQTCSQEKSDVIQVIYV